MIGCEFIDCQDYKDGKCSNLGDYVNKITGESMCPKNINAVPREEWTLGPGHDIY